MSSNTQNTTPRKKVKQPSTQTDGKRLFELLREWIGLIAASLGIFTALLYLAGRSFASGYFAAMNIPSYHVNFSLWEYGEVAWLPLFFYPVVMVFLSSLLGGILSVIADWTASWRTSISEWLKQKTKFRLPALHLPELSKKTKLWFVINNHAFTTLLLVTTMILTLLAVMQFGTWIGRNNVLLNAAQVELISTTPLTLENSEHKLTTSKEQGSYIYKDLFLLTFNDGKYYLFKEVNPITCKPVKVYVIESNQSLQVNLLPAISIANQCGRKTTPTPEVIPTSN